MREGTSLDASAKMLADFETFLLDAVAALGVTAICEEISAEGVARRVGGSSVAKEVCARLGIRHAYCDPDTAERQRLGIADEDWAAREAYWCSAIQDLVAPGQTLLFVCGAGHVDRFAALLERRGMRARIHCRDWTLIDEPWGSRCE